jgi:hypothetical protein
MPGFFRPRALFPLAAIVVALGLGGCVAYPAGYGAGYGGGYYAAPVYGAGAVTYGEDRGGNYRRGWDGGYRGYYPPPPPPLSPRVVGNSASA